MASASWPRLVFFTKLMTMPVFRCTKPRTMAPMSTIILSVMGLNRAGSSPQPLGLPRIWPIFTSASPKKPPVSAPQTKVEMPPQNSSWQKDRLPRLGLIFFMATRAAMTINRP